MTKAQVSALPVRSTREVDWEFISQLPVVEAEGAVELDMEEAVQKVKKRKTTQPVGSVRMIRPGVLKTGGFTFASTSLEVAMERVIKQPKRAVLSHTISKEELQLLQTAYHSPVQLEPKPPVRLEKQGLVDAGIRVRGGNPNYRPQKNIP
ncbi:MAG: hypothetical protein AAB437_02365 [Patescibacteria group bacterium]